jgi:hypothetical protein
MSDATYILDFLFKGGQQPGCMDAADINDDGMVNLTDPYYLLNFLFRGGPGIPAPFPNPNVDPTPNDYLSCQRYTP